MLKRQRNKFPAKTFSVRMEEPKYDALIDFAYKKRFTLTAASTLLLSKALDAENGKHYEPYISED